MNLFSCSIKGVLKKNHWYFKTSPNPLYIWWSVPSLDFFLIGKDQRGLFDQNCGWEPCILKERIPKLIHLCNVLAHTENLTLEYLQKEYLNQSCISHCFRGEHLFFLLFFPRLFSICISTSCFSWTIFPNTSKELKTGACFWLLKT